MTAQIIGRFDVPGSWTCSDDPKESAFIVAVAIRTLALLPSSASERVRARLLATVAMESRGMGNRQDEAIEAEHSARRLNDVPLLRFTLSARCQQSFHTAGCAGLREAIGAQVIALADEAELPTFKIQGRLKRMQALCALDNVEAADAEAGKIDEWAARLDRPLSSVFTAWFRYSFTQGPLPETGAEMPGFRTGLNAPVSLTMAVRTAAPLPDADFGPYEPWVRPLLLTQAGNIEDARQALDNFATPPNDLMLEVS